MSDPVRWLDAEANALETERELLRAAPPADPPDGAQERVWAAMAAQIGLAGAAALGGAQGAAGGALPVNAGGAASAGEIAAAVSAGKVASAAAGAGAAGTAVTGGVTAAAGAAGILKAMLFGAACGGLIVAGYVVVAPSSEAPPARIVEAAEAVAAPVSAPVSPQEDRGLAAQAEPAPAEPPPVEPAPAEPPPVEAPLRSRPLPPAEAPLRSRPLPPAEAPLPNRSPARTGPRAAATPASPGAPLLERAASAPPAARADVLEAAPAPEATGAELGAEGASSPGLRESRLREELTLLGDARAALRRGDASGALRIAEQARHRFPGGALAQEREALTIEALWQSGDRAAAAQRASAFLLAYPSSPHVPRLRSFTTH
ncbi:hypothetical protein WMF11_28395 [Sorangium sp. So ce295]|uniref:hypothetical protein n=1 Tax=Sorangium sp. So ce295 TaxID=3133295 RepID=UPI003F6113D1